MKMKTAPMGQNSWDCYGATVDTTDLEKQLSVLNASLHQAETIKTRLEQQMDNLDVTDTYYDKKISDLQRRLDAQYDRIDEVEETRAELTKATYDEIKKYVAEHNAGMKVSNLYISQVKRKCGIEVGKNLRVAKTLKFSWVSSPSHLVSCYIVLPLFTNPHKGKNKGKKIW